MTELHEGPITLRELSVWFGLKPETITNGSKKAREKKLQRLKTFADYHLEGKKIFIDKVIYPTYSKAFDRIEERMPKEWANIKDENGKVISTLKAKNIDTCSRVAKVIHAEDEIVHDQISENTARCYVNQIKVKKYGHNNANDHGTEGRSESVWMNEKGTDVLPPEKVARMYELRDKCYGEATCQFAEIDEQYRRGMINKEERDTLLGNIDTSLCYAEFLRAVFEEFGFIPDKRTKLINTYEWEEKSL